MYTDYMPAAPTTLQLSTAIKTKADEGRRAGASSLTIQFDERTTYKTDFWFEVAAILDNLWPGKVRYTKKQAERSTIQILLA